MLEKEKLPKLPNQETDGLGVVILPTQQQSLARIADALDEIVLQLNFLSTMAKEHNESSP